MSLAAAIVAMLVPASVATTRHTCTHLPCTMSITFSATIVSTATLALEERDGVLVATETCSGCDEPDRVTRWRRTPGAVAIYTYGQGLAELHNGRWYAARPYQDVLLAGGQYATGGHQP